MGWKHLRVWTTAGDAGSCGPPAAMAERIDAILPVLDEMIGGGLITLERANVIVYRPHSDAESSVTHRGA